MTLEIETEENDKILTNFMKRVFVAALISKDIKEKLVSIQEDPVFPKELRWTEFENLHLTLAFIGSVEEDQLEKIDNVVKEVSKTHSPFLLNLDKITLAPNPYKPRMIWAIGPETPELVKLGKDLRSRLKANNIFVDEKHPIKLHITLARGKVGVLKKLKEKQKIKDSNQVLKNIDLDWPVRDIAVLESRKVDLPSAHKEANLKENFKQKKGIVYDTLFKYHLNSNKED